MFPFLVIHFTVLLLNWRGCLSRAAWPCPHRLPPGPPREASHGGQDSWLDVTPAPLPHFHVVVGPLVLSSQSQTLRTALGRHLCGPSQLPPPQGLLVLPLWFRPLLQGSHPPPLGPTLQPVLHSLSQAQQSLGTGFPVDEVNSLGIRKPLPPLFSTPSPGALVTAQARCHTPAPASRLQPPGRLPLQGPLPSSPWC